MPPIRDCLLTEIWGPTCAACAQLVVGTIAPGEGLRRSATRRQIHIQLRRQQIEGCTALFDKHIGLVLQLHTADLQVAALITCSPPDSTADRHSKFKADRS